MGQAELKPVVTQDELSEIMVLEKSLREQKEALIALRDYVQSALENGGEVEEGFYSARLALKPGRRSVAWKKVVIRLKGDAYARRVIAATKPGPSKTILVVE